MIQGLRTRLLRASPLATFLRAFGTPCYNAFVSKAEHQSDDGFGLVRVSTFMRYFTDANPLFFISASTFGSRPRNSRYASAGSTVFPTEKMYLRRRSATFRSYGPPPSTNAPKASAVITSDHK